VYRAARIFWAESCGKWAIVGVYLVLAIPVMTLRQHLFLKNFSEKLTKSRFKSGFKTKLV
jgi:hypothetical protein